MNKYGVMKYCTNIMICFLCSIIFINCVVLFSTHRICIPLSRLSFVFFLLFFCFVLHFMQTLQTSKYLLRKFLCYGFIGCILRLYILHISLQTTLITHKFVSASHLKNIVNVSKYSFTPTICQRCSAELDSLLFWIALQLFYFIY